MQNLDAMLEVCDGILERGGCGRGVSARLALRPGTVVSRIP